MRFLPLATTLACAALAMAACSNSPSADTAVPYPSTASPASSTGGASTQHVFEVDHFAAGAIVGDVAAEDCTLSGGTSTSCWRVTIAGYPTSYQTGPFCPRTITTPPDQAGIWFDGTDLYDLDGAFVKNLAKLYNDPEWKLYDNDGKVHVTDTKDAFDGAARPDVDPAYHNYCVEGQLAFLPDGKPIETTMLIPVTPIKASGPSSAHPGNLGVTLDGVVIAQSAPVDAILGAHTIAAFDDCGGHYNPVEGYHMHGVTGCGQLDGDAADGETPMFGYAADGYPIHLPLTGAALTAASLDQCNGHSTPTEGYHYHANDPAKNAILPCLSGEYVAAEGPGGPPPGAPPGGAPNTAGPATGGPSLAALAALLGVTDHELADAMATGDVNTAADLLGTTPEAMAKQLGVTVADIQAFISAQSGGAPTPSPTK